MEVILEEATKEDAQSILDNQVRAFKPILEKYEDYETNPANESIEKVVSRIRYSKGAFYKILSDKILVGAISVLWEGDEYWISPMFILPEYQGKGIAQTIINRIENLYPAAASWQLATILEERRNCHLYEKMGYYKTGLNKKLNEKTTLIFYKKTV
ncbi:GNAT family N-acetyltransferase [Halobacillus naozhouensis]|uniref:GNAT family N-acetyltransferase n=1 Tax=Halobacillus naozhouensis TaxID=554880 RepID=A0ABY8J0I7_9BACI|nr:GNAT family N-acetyltransferase [Halobacillus naozhouensis]WFT76004.1 GNAT family N-acetyltransferase [Halobacillus naozhouensis]